MVRHQFITKGGSANVWPRARCGTGGGGEKLVGYDVPSYEIAETVTPIYALQDDAILLDIPEDEMPEMLVLNDPEVRISISQGPDDVVFFTF